MVLKLYTVLRYRYHSARVAINNRNVRISLANWCCKKVIGNPLYQLTRDLAAFPEIHEAFLYVKRIFTTSVPKGIKDFFLTMSRPSPVCAYIYPSDESFNLLETIFNINIKDDPIYLKSLKDRLPLIYDLLMAFSLESCLPVEFKPLIFKLIEKAQEPFRNGPIMDNCHQLNEMPMSFFPSLPLVRTRGCYEMDNKKHENHCTKNYISHKKLTAGIFTVYCIHGKYLIK